MLRKLLITASITVSMLAVAPFAHADAPKVEPAQQEKIAKPAGQARAEAKRAMVDPSSSAKDRSWSSDKTRRERVKMSDTTAIR